MLVLLLLPLPHTLLNRHTKINWIYIWSAVYSSSRDKPQKGNNLKVFRCAKQATNDDQSSSSPSPSPSSFAFWFTLQFTQNRNMLIANFGSPNRNCEIIKFLMKYFPISKTDWHAAMIVHVPIYHEHEHALHLVLSLWVFFYWTKI